MGNEFDGFLLCIRFPCMMTAFLDPGAIKKSVPHGTDSQPAENHALFEVPNSLILPCTVALTASRAGPKYLRGS